MQASLYREWMRRLQDFLAAPPTRPSQLRQPPRRAAG
jgi:hypothetical protein